MDVMDAAVHPGIRDLDEPVTLMNGVPPTVFWTGDPSSAPLAGEMDGHALDGAADELDKAIFGALIYS